MYYMFYEIVNYIYASILILLPQSGQKKYSSSFLTSRKSKLNPNVNINNNIATTIAQVGILVFLLINMCSLPQLLHFMKFPPIKILYGTKCSMSSIF